MSQFIVVFVCLLACFSLRRNRQVNGAQMGAALNAVVIYVALPALTITQIHGMTINGHVMMAAAMPWVSFILAAGWSLALGRMFGWSRGTIGMMTLTTGLGNTSFLGFPLIEAVLGKEGLPTAIISDQLGSFAVVSTLGIIVASAYAPVEHPSGDSIWQRVIKFPPFMATMFALATRGIDFPVEILSAFERIGMTLTPLALMSVGSRIEINFGIFRQYWRRLAIGLGLKLLIAPIVILLVIQLMGFEIEISQRVMILEAAMPSMITGYLIGVEHNLDEKLGSLMVTVGIPIAMVSIPLWAWIL